jgi:diaminopimelate epimerase
MADNIRPALYGAKYTALPIANCKLQGTGDPKSAIRNPKSEIVTIAGKFCESGDILIRDIVLPHLEPGDLLAIPMAGAYTLAMSSNYNLAARPAVVLVRDGEARLIQRRESYADLVDRDLPAPGGHRYFHKYQALGNDYIVLDPADWPETPGPEAIRRICDRHRGVGSDGILWGPVPRTSPPSPLLAEPAPSLRSGQALSLSKGEGGGIFPFLRREGPVPSLRSGQALSLSKEGQGDRFALRLFNPDGGEFEKSGNGLRIFARYLWDHGYVSEPEFQISTPGGIVTAHVLEPTGTRIAMDMGTLSFDSAAIPLAGPRREVIEEPVTVAGREMRITAVTIGNPHCVVFVDELTDLSPQLAHDLGPLLEHLPLFPNRTNVQFARTLDRHTLRIEIWERGAGYTLASGTSSCAAAGAAIRTGRCESPVTVGMPGGEMLVEIADDWSVRLTGTVGLVCEGEVSDVLS